ncbi:MAG: methylmalonyl-CoA epimerase [Chitinophagia bacterium]|jgi:methylmalonyl-CoA/ethylmalonyl-CoA epimerase|nr:methylmalonyl-CoA epimerase [Chitinophagia bacterium]
MKKIEHLGIAVKNLEESEKLFESLLNTHVYKREYVEEQKVTTSFLRAGNNKIELLKASSSDSVINKFIEKRGEGLHHVAFSVSDIRYEMARLTKEGFTLLSEEPQNGADNKLVCFLHPKGANGLLVELVQDAD